MEKTSIFIEQNRIKGFVPISVKSEGTVCRIYVREAPTEIECLAILIKKPENLFRVLTEEGLELEFDSDQIV